jgi:hypothetical protein
MKKLLFLPFLILILNCEAEAAPVITRKTVFTTTGNYTLPNQIGSGINLHKISWNLLGTASACSLKLQSSVTSDFASTSDIITGTCTSNNVSAQTAGVGNYLRLNLTVTFTSSNASLEVFYAGYIDPSSSGGAAGTAGQMAFFDTATSVTGDSGATYSGGNLTLTGNLLTLGNLRAGATSIFYWNGRSALENPVDAANGIATLKFRDNTATANTYLSIQHTTGVTTSAVAILPSTGFGGTSIIKGDDGAGKQFVDIVHYGGSTVTVASQNTVAGAPAARTYSCVTNQLMLLVASGTYTIDATHLVQ